MIYFYQDEFHEEKPLTPGASYYSFESIPDDYDDYTVSNGRLYSPKKERVISAKNEVGKNIDSRFSDSDQKNLLRIFMLEIYNAQSPSVRARMNQDIVKQALDANEFIESELKKIS